MCGIAAIFASHPDAPDVDREELVRIRDHMRRRGPDGEGIWMTPDRRLGLGHRRLSIIDLSEAGAQPMSTADGRLTVVFNGEIYNHLELRAELERKGFRFQSRSDTEVLLHLYAAEGIEMLPRLRGMFAFVLWDQARRSLLAARDPFGIKPLYLADDGQTLRFASQVKALLAGGRISHGQDPAAQAGFFIWGHVPEPFTFVSAVRAVPAGGYLWCESGKSPKSGHYFELKSIFAEAEQVSTTDLGEPPHSRVREALRTALLDSVRHHLIADVDVGVFLSAGIDSTVLASLTQETGASLRTVTLAFREFQGTPHDESPLAEEVSRQCKARHETIWVTREDFQNEAAALFEAMDQPSVDGVNTYFVSRAARRCSLKVALSGLGGDEVFGGYPGFQQIPRMARWLRVFRHLPLAARTWRRLTSPLFLKLTSPKYASLLEYGATEAGAYLLRRALFLPWELPGILGKEKAEAGLLQLQLLDRLEQTTEGLRTSRARISCLEMGHYMRSQLLRDADWAGMAHSLEIRVPYLDVPMLRALAPWLVARDSLDKSDLAHTPEIPLPSKILSRPKTGFSVPVRDWLQAATPQSAIRDPRYAERGLRGWARHVHHRFLEN